MLEILFARFPSLEVLERIIYKDYICNLRFLVKIIKRHHHGKSNVLNKSYLWENIVTYIETLGIKKGDILIVHSSMKDLEKFKISCDEIIKYLFSLVGESGTLVMPAFPYYKEKQDKKLKFDEYDEKVRKYDSKYTYSWTGMLPNIMCTYENAVRSLFPNNSLVAIGSEAEAMMRDNLEGIYPHGSKSAWDYCAKRNAKVLLLGTPASKSLTARHLAEDYLGDKWPIKGWYKVQQYQIRIGDKWVDKEIKVRKQFWSRFLTEHYCIRKIKEKGLLSETIVEDTLIGYVADIKKIRDYMVEQVREGDLIFYKIPRRYWEKQ